jgi:hypothetical protein
MYSRPFLGGYMRIQFEISNSEWERAQEFIDNKKHLGHYGKKAFDEWLNRAESRAGKKLSQDEEMVRKIVQEEIKKALDKK